MECHSRVWKEQNEFCEKLVTIKTINDPEDHDISDSIGDQPSDEDSPDAIAEGVTMESNYYSYLFISSIDSEIKLFKKKVRIVLVYFMSILLIKEKMICFIRY